MTKPVQQILGHMLVNEDFRNAMKADPERTAEDNDYVLTSEELAVTLNIVTSFVDGKMDDAISIVRIECMNWPCN